MIQSGEPRLSTGEKDAVCSHSSVEMIQAYGCSIVLRRIEGRDARELFFTCQPPTELPDAGAQAEAIYRAVLSVLNAEGGSFASIVCETLFHRNLQEKIKSVRAAREHVVAITGGVTFSPAFVEIEQPPLNDQAWLEISVQAVLPIHTQAKFEQVQYASPCDCNECARSQGLTTHIGGETRFYSGQLYGHGAKAYQQTHAMFEAAENMLHLAGLQFDDVVRTWIYLRDMERDYAELNRARREFFTQRDISPPPASTGIGAGLVPASHDLCLSVYAAKGNARLQTTLMTTPTLNEAPTYGADFSRGIRVDEANKVALYISGTASLDATGRSVHAGDFDAQVDRMLLNVSSLLKAQGADYADIVSAITYLKNPADAKRLKEKLSDAGYQGFANSLVIAAVCRPELLCETEALAVIEKR